MHAFTETFDGGVMDLRDAGLAEFEGFADFPQAHGLVVVKDDHAAFDVGKAAGEEFLEVGALGFGDGVDVVFIRDQVEVDGMFGVAITAGADADGGGTMSPRIDCSSSSGMPRAWETWSSVGTVPVDMPS